MRRSDNLQWLLMANDSSVSSSSLNVAPENEVSESQYRFCQNPTLENNPVFLNPQIYPYASHQYSSPIPRYENHHSQISSYQTIQTQHYPQVYFNPSQNHFNYPKPTMQNPTHFDFLAEIARRNHVNSSFNGADANLDQILEAFSNLHLSHNYPQSSLTDDLRKNYLQNLTNACSVGSSPLMRRNIGSSYSYRNRLGSRNMAAATRIGIPYYPRHSELEVMKEEEVDMIIEEVKDQLAELMTNQSRSYTIQRLFESCNQTQMSKILSFIATRQKLLDICFEEHGSRAVQKMIKHLEEPEQKRLLVSVLKPITLQLSKENGGHAYHVILQCMEQFLPEETEPIQEEIAGDCLDLAINKNGCCLLQQCMPYTTLQIRERIVAVIMANALPLSDHPFGNYVVQYVVKMRIPYANANIIAKLRGHFVSLCMNKYASNVVEKCIDPNDVGDENSRRVMTEIFETSDFIRVLQDPYGNYVMQAALNVCKGDVLRRLLSLIQIHSPFLHSHPYGKRVLYKAKENKHRSYGM